MAGGGAAALVLLAAWAGVAHGGVIAVGSLQSCVNDGTNITTRLECQKKIVVSITIEDSSLYQTEELSFSVSCVNSTTGSCPCGCDYTKDPGCSCRNLQQDIRVSLQKTPVYASYPLTAHRTPFNGAPNEDVSIVSTCRAGELDQFPTCGWATNPDTGADIQFSQGFCCTCADYGSRDLMRASIKCDGLFGWGNTQSAHCLQFHPDWWHAGFRIGEFSLRFRINLNITTVTPAPAPAPSSSPAGASAASPPPPGGGSSSGSGGGNSSTEMLFLTPSQPFLRDASKRVSIRLVGDMAGYQQEAQLDGKWLMVPFARGLSIVARNEYLNTRKDEWMIVEPTQVSVDGTECNKVGTSYAAFRNAQGPNACRSPRYTCLSNQLIDLWRTDNDRITRGETPLYRIGRYNGGPLNNEQVMMPSAGQLSLNLPVPGMRTSVVSLSVAADDVQFVVNNSPANITRVQVCTYGGKICGGFEAMVTQGYLYADVRNTGFVPASYIVSVIECSSGVLPILAQHASIDAQSTQTLVFELRMETDRATNSSCTVSVTDSLGGVASTRGFSFYTNATQYEKPPNESDVDGNDPPPGGPTTDWCQQVCPNILDLKCSALRGCFGRLSKGIATIVGPLTALLALVFAYRTGYLQLLCRAVAAVLFTRRPAAASPAGEGGKGSPGSRAGGKKGKRRQEHTISQEEEGQDGTPRPSANQRAAQAKSQWPPSAEEPPSDAIAAVRLASESGGQGAASAASSAGSRWPAGWRMQRQGSGSFGRAQASLTAAVQQAHDMLASLRNLVTNPLAVPTNEQAPQLPLPVRVAMPAAYPPVQPAAVGGPALPAGWAALPQSASPVPCGSPSPAAAPLLAPSPAGVPQPLPPTVPAGVPLPLPAMAAVGGLAPLPAPAMVPSGALLLHQAPPPAAAVSSSAPAQLPLAHPAAAQPLMAAPAPSVTLPPPAVASPGALAAYPPGWRPLGAAASGSSAPSCSPAHSHISLAQLAGAQQPATGVAQAGGPVVSAVPVAQPVAAPSPAASGRAASTRAALEEQLRRVLQQREQLQDRLQQHAAAGAASGHAAAVPQPGGRGPA